MSTLMQILIGTHVLAGLTAVVAGAATMLATKGPGVHPRRGHAYLGALTAVFATGLAITLTDWAHLWHLAGLGGTAVLWARVGFTARRRQPKRWRVIHILGMSGSYVAMLTAFYVDNGPRLPVWNRLPPFSFWILPAAVASPVIIKALHRNTGRKALSAGPHPPRPKEPHHS